MLYILSVYARSHELNLALESSLLAIKRDSNERKFDHETKLFGQATTFVKIDRRARAVSA